MSIVIPASSNASIIVPNTYLILLVAFLILGIVIGYLIRDKHLFSKKSNKKWDKPQKNKHKQRTFSGKLKWYFRRLKYGTGKGIIIGIIWVVICLLILPLIERTNQDLVTTLSPILFLFSFFLGIYNAYPLTMWIDKKIPNTEFGIWMRRITAVTMVLIGFGVVFVLLMAASITIGSFAIQGLTNGPWVSFMAFIALIASFFLGIALFAGYIEFTFERKAGVLAFIGKQKF